RGVRVNFANATFEGGSLAELRNGIQVDVDGRLAADGSSVDATRIRFFEVPTRPDPGDGSDAQDQWPGNSARPANSNAPDSPPDRPGSGGAGNDDRGNGNDG